MRRRSIATVLGLTLGCFATSELAAQCEDAPQQDLSQQNSADEAHVRGDLKAGSQCADPADEAISEKKNEDAAERAKGRTDERSSTAGQGESKESHNPNRRSAPPQQ